MINKGLEALQRLFDNNYGNNFYIKAEEDAEIIEKELKLLEIFKKAFDFEIEDYTEDEYGAIKVKYNRIILEDKDIDMAKEVLL